MRERAHQHVRRLAPRRVWQLEPVPLDLDTGRMLDIDMRATLHAHARFTMRPQVPVPDVTRERPGAGDRGGDCTNASCYGACSGIVVANVGPVGARRVRSDG
jgi:hypothetical protein